MRIFPILSGLFLFFLLLTKSIFDIMNMVLVVIFLEVFMAFFLKKTRLNGRTYLSIVESFYSHDKKGTAHRTYKSLSSVETLLASGIEDPIAYCQKEVDQLNAEREKKSEKLISEISPKRYLGYFPSRRSWKSFLFRSMSIISS